MPLKPRFFPVLIPITFAARAHEKLHFHLLKLAHTEDKLTRYNFVAKCFTNLCNAKRYLHTRTLLHVEEVYKNALCRFGAQVNGVCFFCYRAKLGRKHQVKLADICPVA